MKRLTVLFIIIPFAMILTACSGSEATPTPDISLTTTPVKEPSTVTSEGRLEPAQNREVAFNATGNVAEIVAKEGEQIKVGDPIARLDTVTTLLSELESAKQELLLAQQALAELKRNAGKNKGDAELALAVADKDLDTAKDHFEALKYPRGTAEDIEIAQADFDLYTEQFNTAEEDYFSVRWESFDDPSRVSAYNEMQNKRALRDEAKDKLEWLVDKPDQFEIEEKTAKFNLAQATYDKAKKYLESLKDGMDPDLLSAAEARVKAGEAGVKAAESALANAELRAPINGTVTKVDLKIGEYVAPGKIAAYIADTAKWVVKTNDLTEIDVVNVKAGQKATITLDALPDVTLKGVVDKIDNIFEEKQGDITYTVTVNLTETDPKMRWGMTAKVTFEE